MPDVVAPKRWYSARPVPVVLSCPAASRLPCRGALRYRSTAIRHRTIAAARFELAPGRRTTVRLPFSRKHRRDLCEAGSTSASLNVVAKRSDPASVNRHYGATERLIELFPRARCSVD